MREEVAGLQLAAAARPRFSLAARFLKRAIEDPNTNYTIIQNTTILLPSNQALIDTLLRVWDNGTEWGRTISYNIISGLYTLRQLRQLPRNAEIPTLLEGANLTKFNPRFSVAIGQPETKLVTWAAVKLPNLHDGVFLKAHGVDRGATEEASPSNARVDELTVAAAGAVTAANTSDMGFEGTQEAEGAVTMDSRIGEPTVTAAGASEDTAADAVVSSSPANISEYIAANACMSAASASESGFEGPQVDELTVTAAGASEGSLTAVDESATAGPCEDNLKAVDKSATAGPSENNLTAVDESATAGSSENNITAVDKSAVALAGANEGNASDVSNFAADASESGPEGLQEEETASAMASRADEPTVATAGTSEDNAGYASNSAANPSESGFEGPQVDELTVAPAGASEDNAAPVDEFIDAAANSTDGNAAASKSAADNDSATNAQDGAALAQDGAALAPHGATLAQDGTTALQDGAIMLLHDRDTVLHVHVPSAQGNDSSSDLPTEPPLKEGPEPAPSVQAEVPPAEPSISSIWRRRGLGQKEGEEQQKRTGELEGEKGEQEEGKGEQEEGKGEQEEGKGEQEEGKGEQEEGKGEQEEGKGEQEEGKGEQEEGKGEQEEGKGEQEEGKGEQEEGKGEQEEGKGEQEEGKGEQEEGKGEQEEGKGEQEEGKGEQEEGKGEQEEGKGEQEEGKGEQEEGKGERPERMEMDGEGERGCRLLATTGLKNQDLPLTHLLSSLQAASVSATAVATTDNNLHPGSALHRAPAEAAVVLSTNQHALAAQARRVILSQLIGELEAIQPGGAGMEGQQQQQQQEGAASKCVGLTPQDGESSDDDEEEEDLEKRITFSGPVGVGKQRVDGRLGWDSKEQRVRGTGGRAGHTWQAWSGQLLGGGRRLFGRVPSVVQRARAGAGGGGGGGAGGGGKASSHVWPDVYGCAGLSVGVGEVKDSER
ncbi:unnamed protein product [Closterium sp. Yama58-4]|nr:unnamed protein product [Closterium sp. Yama58-4]